MPDLLQQIENTSAAVADHASTLPDLQRIQHSLTVPFWHHADFWISTLIGAAGLYFAIAAFRAAKDAVTAATEAGKFMTMQTVAIELMAISQRLSGLDTPITFREARTLLTEITGKLHRLTSPFQDNPTLSPTITNIHATLTSMKTALRGSRPSAAEPEIPGQTYNAIEGEADTLNLYVNELLGQLETQSHQHLAT